MSVLCENANGHVSATDSLSLTKYVVLIVVRDRFTITKLDGGVLTLYAPLLESGLVM